MNGAVNLDDGNQVLDPNKTNHIWFVSNVVDNVPNKGSPNHEIF